MLSSDGSPSSNSTNSPSESRCSRSSSNPKQGSGTQSRSDAVENVIGSSVMNDPALQSSIQQTDDPQLIAVIPPPVSGGVQDSINAKLEGVPVLRCADTIDNPKSTTDQSTGKVAAAGIVSEVLAPVTALDGGFFREEEFGGGREAVEGIDRARVEGSAMEVCVRVMEATIIARSAGNHGDGKGKVWLWRWQSKVFGYGDGEQRPAETGKKT